jgi:uncharacterized membrane protein
VLKSVLEISVILLLPALILYLKDRWRIIQWLSPIVVCYIIGIIVGNLPFIILDKAILKSVAEITVCLATPILLFSCDFIKWIRNARNTLISFFAGTVSVIIIAVLAFFLFKDQIDEGWKVAGMTIGLYTGATVNLTAIGIALDIDEETFIVLNSSDLLFGGMYFFFLITFGKKVFSLFLPVFPGYNGKKAEEVRADVDSVVKQDGRKPAVSILIALGISAAILAVGASLSFMVTGKMSSTLIILVITTLGIAFSFNKKVSRLSFNYETGDYLLLMFALALGALASYKELVTGNLPLVLFCGIVVFGSVALHLLIAYLFKLEDDTVIITSVAVLYGPAFILPVAEAIRNREVLVAGLSMALLGNAFGTYLGIGLAYALHYLF